MSSTFKASEHSFCDRITWVASSHTPPAIPEQYPTLRFKKMGLNIILYHLNFIIEIYLKFHSELENTCPIRVYNFSVIVMGCIDSLAIFCPFEAPGIKTVFRCSTHVSIDCRISYAVGVSRASSFKLSAGVVGTAFTNRPSSIMHPSFQSISCGASYNRIT